MPGKTLIAFFLAISASAVLGKVSYAGYSVLRGTPTTLEQVEVLKKLESQGVQFWKGPSPPGISSDLFLPKGLQLGVTALLKEAGIEVQEYIHDIQTLLDGEGETVKLLPKGARFEHDAYLEIDAIYSWLDEQAAKHSDFVSTVSIGSSYEGRDLKVLKIAKPSDTVKPIIWVDANIHAREWITSAVTIYVIDKMLNSNNPVYQAWTEDFDWYILTVHNPDGFVFTHDEDRMWRKTRSETSEPGCYGADANRNYGFHWMTGGASDNPCDYQLFAGATAFSEVETQAVSNYLTELSSGGNLAFYLSLHSYSQYILIPYGVEVDFPQHDEYMEIGLDVAAAISKRYGTQFTPGNIVDLLYVASGGSMDWVKGVLDVPLTYTFELRDEGQFGFVLPPGQIVPSGLEFLDGLEVLVDALRARKHPTRRNVHVPAAKRS